MAEPQESLGDRILIRAIWAAVALVAILLIVVGYIFFKYEEQRTSTLVQRELTQAKKAERKDADNVLSNVVQGELQYREGNADAAIAEFRDALEKEPDNARALINLGTVYSQKREYDKAVDQFHEVIRLRNEGEYAHIDVFLAEARYQLGLIRTIQRRCPDAVKELEAALKITPMDADAHQALGHCHLVMEQYDKALRALGNATGFDPTFAMAHYEMGQAYEKLDKKKEAIESYNRAVMADPSLTEAAEALRMIDAKQGIVDPRERN